MPINITLWKRAGKSSFSFQLTKSFELLTDDKNGIILLITDHVDWSDEYQHLVMLQEKINVYITFHDEKQYEEIYKEEEIAYGVIEIHFLHNLTVNAEKFLQSVQNQVAELGIRIQYCVSQEETDEIR